MGAVGAPPPKKCWKMARRPPRRGGPGPLWEAGVTYKKNPAGSTFFLWSGWGPYKKNRL